MVSQCDKESVLCKLCGEDGRMQNGFSGIRLRCQSYRPSLGLAVLPQCIERPARH